MTRREQLREQYEDALFALIMDEVSEIEGQKALEENEAQKNDPDAAVPDITMKRCRRVIDREFAKRNARTAGRISIRVLNKVAMVALLGAFLFTGAFAASETFRVNTLNLVLETFEDSTHFRFEAENDLRSDQSNEELKLTVGWVPDGFVLEEQGSDNNMIWYTYHGLGSDMLHIDLTNVTPGYSTALDTEDALVENIQIDGYEVMITTKEGYIQAAISLNSNTQLLYILGYGEHFDQDTILKIVKNITY